MCSFAALFVVVGLEGEYVPLLLCCRGVVVGGSVVFVAAEAVVLTSCVRVCL